MFVCCPPTFRVREFVYCIRLYHIVSTYLSILNIIWKSKSFCFSAWPISRRWRYVPLFSLLLLYYTISVAPTKPLVLQWSAPAAPGKWPISRGPPLAKRFSFRSPAHPPSRPLVTVVRLFIYYYYYILRVSFRIFFPAFGVIDFTTELVNGT